jgi:hypothetical protein
MMIKEVNMRQFKQLGWISQTVMILVMLSAMSQSNAMSVRERYLQEHPAAKVESSPEKPVVEVTEKHVIQKHEHRHALKNHVKAESVHAKHSKHRSIEQSVKNDTVATPQKQQASHPVKKHVPRVVTPKLTPNKFGRQQARDAELALQHQPINKEVETKPEPTPVVPSKHHHAPVRIVTTKHFKERHSVANVAKPAAHHAAIPHQKHHRKAISR